MERILGENKIEHLAKYPRIEVFFKKIRHNIRVVTKICENFGVRIVDVTKAFGGDPVITKVFVEEGLDMIGDSRIQNLKKQKDIKATKMLLRLSMISEASDVVKFADISLNSEIETIRALSREAVRRNKIHKIILMIDVGDLREGIFNEDEIEQMVKNIIKLTNIKLIGVGTNLTCFFGGG